MTAPERPRPGALAGARLGHCGGCSRRVWWVRLDTGGRMPVDPGVDADGTVAAYRDSSGAPAGYVLKKDAEPDPGHSRYMTHFATCPKPPARRGTAPVRAAPLPAGVVDIARARQARQRARGR